MKRHVIFPIVLVLLALLGACNDESIPATIVPSAQPLLATLTEIAKTVEAIGQTATSYSVTPTHTPVPTITPDRETVSKLIRESIEGQLISNFGVKITLGDVKFGPLGAQQFTNLYIEINCVGDSNTACPAASAIIAVLDACKEKKKKVLENVPDSVEVLTITIFDPSSLPRVVEINWRDVKDYLKGDMRADVLSRLIRYVQ